MKTNSFKSVIVFVLLILMVISCNKESKNNQSKNSLLEAVGYNFTPKDTTWKSLSIREKIGQTMIIRAYYDEQISQFGSVEKMMEEYPVGGLFIPDWKFLYVKLRVNVIPNIQKTVQEYEDASRLPLIITEDFERGVGSTYSEYTHLPFLFFALVVFVAGTFFLSFLGLIVPM